MRTEGTETYDYDKTHLLILKVDYDKNQASLFVNPELSKKEPKATLVADGEENDLKNGLKGISFRYRRGYKGRVGNFRFADNWATAIGKQKIEDEGSLGFPIFIQSFQQFFLNHAVADQDSCFSRIP